MYWNYRVVRQKDPTGSVSYEIREVYYNERNEPWAHGSAALIGDKGPEDIRRVITKMILPALDKPVLNAWDIEKGKRDGELEDERAESPGD